MILVENTQACIFGIGNLPVEGIVEPVSVALKPGINQVAPAVWSALEALPVVQERLQLGSLKVAAETENEEIDLPKIAPLKAIKLVKSTFDRDLLNAWFAVETRPAVVKQIEQQFALLADAGKKE